MSTDREDAGAQLALDIAVTDVDPADDQLAWPGIGEPAGNYGRLPASGLEGFSTGLFVQARASEARHAARLVDHTGVGVVFTLDRRHRKKTEFQQLFDAVDLTRRRTLSQNILVDRARYAGTVRKSAAAGVDAEWVDLQHEEMKLRWALTDSGFIDRAHGVREVLESASALDGHVVAALPMDFKVLRDSADDIADQVRQQQHPVAIMLGHAYDPFDAPGVVEALLYVIRHSERPVLLLRSDTSALGALTHGAAVGAIGAHSGLRHIYPITQGGGPESLAFVIPELLGYYREQRFAQAYLRDPGVPTWHDNCWFCAGRDLTWIGNLPDSQRFVAAFQHSVAAIAGLGARITARPDLDPAHAWTALCRGARAAHEAIANPSGSAWEPKPALAHWTKVAPATTVSR